ncbi:hypothetical protein ThvES_00018830 [Thiovulum sp. ES]|nr:hypothetical protein ThvES_00018830 [Thiovulum sp. ES]
MNKTNLLLSLPLATLLFSGCGTDDGTTEDSNETVVSSPEVNTTDETTQEIQTISISGKVIDGYIAGANVFIDLNENYEHDADEPSAETGESGDFEISSELASGEYRIVSVGGTDVLTETTFENTLYTVVEIESEDLTGVYLSPISTIVSESYFANKSTSSLDEIKSLFTAEMNLSTETDILNTDFIETALNGETSLFIANQEVLSAINVLSNDISLVREDDKPERVAIETIVKTRSFDRSINLTELGIPSSYIDGIAVESEEMADASDDMMIAPIAPEEITREDLEIFLKETQDDYYSHILDERDRSEDTFDKIDWSNPETGTPVVDIDGEKENLADQLPLPVEITLLKETTEALFDYKLTQAVEGEGTIDVDLSSVFDLENREFVDAEIVQIIESEKVIEDELDKALTDIPDHLDYAGSELNKFMETIGDELNSTMSDRLKPIMELRSGATNFGDIASGEEFMSSGDEVKISLGDSKIYFEILNENGTDLELVFTLNTDEEGYIADSGNSFQMSGTLVGENYKAENILFVESDTNNTATIETLTFEKDENSLSVTNVEMIEGNLVSISGSATTSTFEMNAEVNEVSEGQISVSGEINFTNNLSISGSAEIIMESSGGVPPSIPETMRVTKSETVEASVSVSAEDVVTLTEYAVEEISSFDGNITEMVSIVATEGNISELAEVVGVSADEITEYAEEIAESGIVTDDILEYAEEIAESGIVTDDILEYAEEIAESGIVAIDDVTDEMLENGVTVAVENSEDTVLESVFENEIVSILIDGKISTPDGETIEGELSINDGQMYLSNVSLKSENVSLNAEKIVIDHLGEKSTSSSCVAVVAPEPIPETEEDKIEIYPNEEEVVEEQIPPMIPESDEAISETETNDDEVCETVSEELSPSITITGLTASVVVDGGTVQFARDVIMQENGIVGATGETIFGQTTVQSKVMDYENFHINTSVVTAGNMTGMTVESFNDGDVIYSQIVTPTAQNFYLKNDGSTITVLDENGYKLVK